MLMFFLVWGGWQVYSFDGSWLLDVSFPTHFVVVGFLKSQRFEPRFQAVCARSFAPARRGWRRSGEEVCEIPVKIIPGKFIFHLQWFWRKDFSSLARNKGRVYLFDLHRWYSGAGLRFSDLNALCRQLILPKRKPFSKRRTERWLAGAKIRFRSFVWHNPSFRFCNAVQYACRCYLLIQ